MLHESPRNSIRRPRRGTCSRRRTCNLRVMLGAQTIDPSAGSEDRSGWGWAEALQRHRSVSSVRVEAHPGQRGIIEERLASDSTLSKLSFEWVLPNPDPCEPGGSSHASGGLLGEIDIAHHVTPGTILLERFVSDLGAPYVIGPVGGGQAVPLLDALRFVVESPEAGHLTGLARSLLVLPMGEAQCSGEGPQGLRRCCARTNRRSASRAGTSRARN
jgi:hypothetical protein